ncbi:MAG TPA: 2-octaprenylphenol hydroxylase, partial [Ruminococcaceae bacterium]|nr:2-octaprenylphenol hydroxylase [Oscillospiraceae bacterium]
AIIEMEAAPSRVNRKSFEKDIDQIIEKYLSMPMSEIRIDQLIREIFQIAFANHIKIPREFALLSKTLGTLQGLLEKLDPQLDSLAVAKPIAKKLIIQSLSPEKIGGRAKKDLWKYGELLHMLPSAMLNFLTKMEEEDFTVSFEMKEEDRIRKQMEKVSNRITFSVMLLAVSIILAGVLVASALSAGASGEMYRLNLLVLKSGFAVESVIVLGLIVSMFRSRK